MTADASTGKTCTQCGNQALEDGFIEDMGQASQGYARWVAGPLKRGVFGGARRLGRLRREILAFRCRECGHLELYGGDQI
jgi:predicted nucleic-acid-binding Zn-ribbon protein